MNRRATFLLTAVVAMATSRAHATPLSTPVTRTAEPASKPTNDPSARNRRRLMLGVGSAFFAGSAGMLAMMSVGLVRGARLNDTAERLALPINDAARAPTDIEAAALADVSTRGHRANSLAFAGGFAAGLLAITGAILIAGGLRARPLAVEVSGPTIRWRF